MRILLILFSILIVNSVVAEPKQLICVSSAESEVKRWTAFGGSNDLATAEKCRDFAEYGWKETFTFDTRGFSNSQYSKAEASRMSCGGYSTGIKASKLSATPSVIIFNHEPDFGPFNIDRKTLKAGFKTKRNYKCKIEDVDTSDNLI